MSDQNTQQLDLFHFDDSRANFESYCKKNGITFWYGRDFMKMLGYESFDSFKKAVQKAMTACNALSVNIEETIIPIKREIDGVEVQDYKLSRYGCYLTVMNGDTKKPLVARAQGYFAAIAECIEQHKGHVEGIERVLVREEMKGHEKTLSGVAHSHGVTNYGFFQNAGYRGMYNMDIRQIRTLKGVPADRSPLDFMGTQELAANLFRITQTEAKIVNQNVRGQSNLERTAQEVGKKVRATMQELSGSRPEALPAAQDLNEVKKNLKSPHREFKKIDGGKKSLPKKVEPLDDV